MHLKICIMRAFWTRTNDTKLIFCVDSKNSESIEVVASRTTTYTTSGTYSWTAPNGVTSVYDFGGVEEEIMILVGLAVVVVGSACTNNISVTPGQSYKK